MNEIIASNIRLHREQLAWTQEHLAEAAELNLRTVQRAEGGQGMSAETLQAVAGALNLSVGALRSDPLEILARAMGVPKDQVTPELIATRVKEMAAKYLTVPLSLVNASADLHPVFDAQALHFDCSPRDDSIQDAAAALMQYLRDLLDVGTEAEFVQRREFEKAAFELVVELRRLGCAVSIAFHNHSLLLDTGARVPSSTLYVIVSLAGEAPPLLALPKNRRASFE